MKLRENNLFYTCWFMEKLTIVNLIMVGGNGIPGDKQEGKGNKACGQEKIGPG